MQDACRRAVSLWKQSTRVVIPRRLGRRFRWSVRAPRPIYLLSFAPCVCPPVCVRVCGVHAPMSSRHARGPPASHFSVAYLFFPAPQGYITRMGTCACRLLVIDRKGRLIEGWLCREGPILRAGSLDHRRYLVAARGSWRRAGAPGVCLTQKPVSAVTTWCRQACPTGSI